MTGWGKILVNSVLMLALQVLVLNYVNLGGFINPYVYIVPILLLPFAFAGWALLLISFATGFVVDSFMDTSGIHTAATVLMAFCRPGVIRLISTRDRFDEGLVPQFSTMGGKWVFVYTTVLVGIHHLCLFSLEVFKLSYFHITLGLAAINTLVSTILILLLFYIFDGSSRR